MKRISVIFLTLLIAFSAVACGTPAPKDYKQMGKELMTSESIGQIKIGMNESDLTKAIGQPDIKADPSILSADNKNHADWTYEAKGLRVNMVEGDSSGSEYKVYSINVVAPCDLATKKGIKIGSTKDAVMSAYGNAVEDKSDEATKNTIIAGSTSGGVVFGIDEGKVSIIFIGAVLAN